MRSASSNICCGIDIGPRWSDYCLVRSEEDSGKTHILRWGRTPTKTLFEWIDKTLDEGTTIVYVKTPRDFMPAVRAKIPEPRIFVDVLKFYRDHIVRREQRTYRGLKRLAMSLLHTMHDVEGRPVCTGEFERCIDAFFAAFLHLQMSA